MGSGVVASRIAATVLALALSRGLYGVLRGLLAPYEASAAVKQIHDSNEEAALVSTFLHLDVSSFAALGVAVVSLFIIWLWPLRRQGGEPT